MAKIPQYTPDVSPQAPLPGRSPERLYAEPDAFGGGRGMGNLGAGLSDASETLYNAEQRDEVSNVAAQMATLRGKLTAQFITGAAKDNGDPDFTSKFMEDATNQVAQLGGQYQTKAGMSAFARESASLTSDLLARSTEHNVAVAGARAVGNFQTTINQNAGTLFNDPSQYSSISKTLDAQFADPNGPYSQIPPEHRAQLLNTAQEQLAVAAGRGVAMMNPDLAEKLYKAGNLPGQDKLTEQGNAQIISYITTQQNAERTKQALAIAQQERQDRMASEADEVSVLRKLETDPSNPGNVDMILHSRMKAPAMLTMLELAKHVGGPDSNHDTNTYGPAFVDTYDAVHSGKVTTPDQLYPMVKSGQLTVAGVNMLTNEMIGKRTPQGQIEAEMKTSFVNAFKQQLSGSNELLHLRDPNGDKQVASAMAWFLPALEKAKQDPKFNPAEALDPNNPKSLWAGVMKFKRSPQQQMKDLMDANGGSAGGGPAKVTNETDYAKLPSGSMYVGPDGKTRTKK